MNNTHDIIDDRIDVVTRGLHGPDRDAAPAATTTSSTRSRRRDYYSLYGVFASCDEPTVPPLFEPPPKTEAYAKFAKEMAARERQAARVRAAEEGRAGGRKPQAGGRVPAGRPRQPRPAGPGRLHADRRRDRPEPEDGRPLAVVSDADAEGEGTRSSPPGTASPTCRRQEFADARRGRAAGRCALPACARRSHRRPSRWPTWQTATPSS